MRSSNMAMTPIQIASNVIEKLQEENRISLDALHRTQNEIKHLQRQLLEKEQLIKILEDRLRRGSNSYLEISNRQKEITIKHLELQIQKLLKENQDLDLQINSVKADICGKCETKALIGSLEEKKSVSRLCLKKSIVKDLPCKSTASQEGESREKMLERIIEHKDKRIQHLSKEVQKLSRVEKELTNKIYRLTKLLPMSQMPSEMLIECLLNEIKSLEAQVQLDRGVVYSTLKPNLSVKGVSIFPSNSNTSMKSANFKQKNFPVSDFDNGDRENATLVSNLHKLFSDVSELKQYFASENEKMHQNLTRNSIKSDGLKIQWNEIMSRVNDIAESLSNVIRTNPIIRSSDSSNMVEKESVQRLQDMLKNALELTSQYEEENALLKANLEKLNEQLEEEQENLQRAETKIRQRTEELSRFNLGQDVSEVQHLRELLNDKQRQLDSAEKHLRTCQTLIEELRKLPKELDHHSTQTLRTTSKDRQDATDAIPSDSVLQLRSLEKKLEVAEKNIKTCEEVIEELQNVIRTLEEENVKLDSDLHMARLNKVVSDANNNHYIALKTKLDETEDQLLTITDINKELQEKLVSLEKENTKLRADLLRTSSKDASFQSINEKNTSLKNKLEIAEGTIGVLENNIVQLQTSVEKLRDENAELRMKLHSSENKQYYTKTYDDDATSLRNQLFLKEEEIKDLKESLDAFKRKAFEMNHYRKTLRQEIEKLCDMLMASAESTHTTASRKAIYNAAVLQSAQAILRLDADLNVQPEPTESTDALEEMKNQVSVYLTEVARVHELLTLKEQQREELLKQYLDISSQIYLSGSSSHELFIQEQPSESDVESHPPVVSASGAVKSSSGTAVTPPSDNAVNTPSGTKTNTSSGTAVSTPSVVAIRTPSGTGVNTLPGTANASSSTAVSTPSVAAIRTPSGTIVNTTPGTANTSSGTAVSTPSVAAIRTTSGTAVSSSSSSAIRSSSGTAVSTPSATAIKTSSAAANRITSATPVHPSSESGIYSTNKNVQTEKSLAKQDALNCPQPETMFNRVQDELEASKSITTYLLSKCSELEDLLEKERIELVKCRSENAAQLEVIESLKSQLSGKCNLTKRLNTLIDMMRSKECNDEITMEQLKSEIEWLVNENQKVFEKVTSTQSELCRCKEENSRIQNDLNSLKRQLVNEKYEHAKVNNELKHLRIQLTHSQSSINHDT